MTDTTTTAPALVDGLPADRPRFLLNLQLANAYPGACRVCGARVDAYAGHRTRLASGSWAVQHASLDACRAAYPAHAAFLAELAANEAALGGRSAYPTPRPVDAVTRTPERGEAFYRRTAPGVPGAVALGDVHVEFVRVSVRQGRSGAWYLNRWDGHRWAYVGDGRANFRAGVYSPVTAAEAGAFGAAFHRCVFCGRDLDDAPSITAGYGPTCAQRRGLPWGGRTASTGGTFVGHADPVRPAVPAAPDSTCRTCGEEFATVAEAAPDAHPCAA